MQLTLTYVSRKEAQGAKGPYTRLSIKAQEYGDKYLSGFGRDDNASWKVGDTVEVAEVKEVVKDDKTYLNFEMPKIMRNNSSNAEVMHAMQQLMTTMGAIKAKLDHIEKCLEYDKRISTGMPEPKF